MTSADNKNRSNKRGGDLEMAMKSKQGEGNVDRRGFLRSLGSSVAGTAAVAAGTVAASPTAAEAAENAADRVKKRYRETDHVKAYYRTNRY